MKKILFSVFIFNSLVTFSQEQEILQYENVKTEILAQIETLNDSIKNIDIKIGYLKSKEIHKMVSDSSLRATVRKGAKLKKIAHPVGEIITTLSEDTEVVILDYSGGYFGVCTDSLCGYMSELWIKKNEKIINFIKIKEFEIKELKRLQREQNLREQKTEWAELEKKYIKKYGQKTYDDLIKGFYWIGMNKEMATISLGTPKDVNRTVGSWGVHEQWIYDNLYLYFENGKLSSYQD